MKILIANPIDCQAIQRLRAEHEVCCSFYARREELQRLLRDTEVLIFRSSIRVSADLIDNAPHLRLLIRAGLGCDNVDLGRARERGITYRWVPLPTEAAIVAAVHELELPEPLPV